MHVLKFCCNKPQVKEDFSIMSLRNSEDDSKKLLEQHHASAILEAMRYGTFEIDVVTTELVSCEDFPRSNEVHEQHEAPIYENKIVSQVEEQPPIETKVCVSSPSCSSSPVSSVTSNVAHKKYERKRVSKSKDLSPKIRRPPNSFMLFAQEHRTKMLKERPDVRNKNISKVLGNMWKLMPQEEKKEYDRRAREAAAEHKRLNPTYVYNPQEARLRKAQRDQAKLALRAQRQRKTSLTPEEDCSPLPHLPQMQHLPPLLRHARHAATALAPSPHKVLQHHHHHYQGAAATAAVSASVREQVMHGMVPPSPPHHASPPPRFYPSVYESETYHQNPQQPPQHHYPSPHHQSTWYQYPHQQQPQTPNNSCNYGTASSGRTMSHPSYAGYNGAATSYMSPQHQGMMLPSASGEDEEDLAALSSRAVNQYEVEGTLPPAQQPQQPRVEEAVTTEEQPSSDPDSQPLPPFQHAFGSTEIGRFAHEGFSAQVRARPPACLPSPLQGSPPGSLPWSPRGSATTQQFPISY